MTFEQLRIFVGVAEREHMTRGAEALHVTQSTASAAIAALEVEHRVVLFHRIGRRIELTDTGRVFLAEARAILNRVADAELALLEFSQLSRGTLRLVASQTIASYWLPVHLVAFCARYPQIEVELVIANTEQAAQSVHDGTAELGFVEGMVSDVSLEHWSVAHDCLSLVGTVEPAQADEEWIRSARWVMREQGSGTRSTFEEALRRRGIPPEALHIALTLPSNEAVCTAVAAGVGVAALSALVVARAVHAGALRAIPFALAERPFFGLRHKERYHSKAAKALLECIKEGSI
jgi:DNA-binding transcriptional LysR family regulator